MTSLLLTVTQTSAVPTIVAADAAVDVEERRRVLRVVRRAPGGRRAGGASASSSRPASTRTPGDGHAIHVGDRQDARCRSSGMSTGSPMPEDDRPRLA